MKSRLLYNFLFLIISFVFFSCQSVEYRNQSPAFSFTYPSSYEQIASVTHSSVICLQTPFRRGASIKRVEVLVFDLPPNTRLKDLTDYQVNMMIKSNPRISNARVVRSTIINLKDGRKANEYLLNWDFDNGIAVVNRSTLSRSMIKGGKVISISGSIAGSDIYSVRKIIDSFKLDNVRRRTAYSGQNNNSVTVAVMDFKPIGISPVLADNISELVRTELIMTEGFTVLERSQVDKILKEQGFQMTGCTETSCAVEIGQMLSAKKIIVGSVMQMGSKIIISGRLVDVEKGVGELAANESADSVDELDEASGQFVRTLTSY